MLQHAFLEAMHSTAHQLVSVISLLPCDENLDLRRPIWFISTTIHVSSQAYMQLLTLTSWLQPHKLAPSESSVLKYR